MSEIKALEKLREFVGKELYEKERIGHGDYSHLHVLIEDVKSEIAECYMKVPVDADGVPIHVGDVIQFVNEQGGTGAHVVVNAVSKYYAYYGEGKHFYKASMCRHVKPDPVKELLDDVCLGTIRYPRERIAGYLEDNHSIGEAVLLDVRDRLTAIYDEQQRVVDA